MRVKSKRGKIQKKKRRFADKTLIFLIAAILLFGIVMIYDSTAVYSYGTFGGAYHFLFLQVGWIAVGLVGFYAFYRLDFAKIRKISFPMFIAALILLAILALVNLFSECEISKVIFAPCINGAHRWIYLNPPPFPSIPLVGILGFQPSEFAKFGLIVYLAAIMEKNSKKGTGVFVVFLIVTGLISFLVMMQPNMSTSVLLFLIGLSMYFVSGSSLYPLIVALPLLILAGVGFVFSSDYRRLRLMTFLNPSEAGDLSLGYHIKQILIALGSGGLFGIGFGQSRQKFQYLPEVASDSIFAIIGEEFGFVGTTVFVLLFSFLIYKGYTISKNCPDLFGKLLGVGVTTWFAFQFFVNVAAMTRLIPLTGVPIPLVSYGGSSTVFSLMALGLLANVSSRSS